MMFFKEGTSCCKGILLDKNANSVKLKTCKSDDPVLVVKFFTFSPCLFAVNAALNPFGAEDVGDDSHKQAHGDDKGGVDACGQDLYVFGRHGGIGYACQERSRIDEKAGGGCICQGRDDICGSAPEKCGSKGYGKDPNGDEQIYAHAPIFVRGVHQYGCAAQPVEEQPAYGKGRTAQP